MPVLPSLRLSGVAVICCLITIFAIAVKPVVDPDFWWHLATGRYIVANHLIPHHDVFSLTAQDHSWITHEWVTELLFYAGWLLGGARLLMIATALVITCTFGVVYLSARERGALPLVAAPIVLLSALASAHTWGTRPQMLSMLLTALFGLALTRMLVRALPAPPLWLPIAMLLWVNLHGGFIFGLALLVIAVAGYVAADLARLLQPAPVTHDSDWLDVPIIRPRVQPGRCVLVVILTTAATLVNPNGLAGALYPLSYLGNNASTRYISEWVSPNFHETQYLFFEGLVLLLLLGALVNPRRARLADVLVLLPFLYLAFDSVRNISLIAVLGAPVAAELLSGALPRPWIAPRRARALPRGRIVLNWLCASAIAIGVGLTTLGKVTNTAQAQAVAARYPSGALRYIQGHGLPARGFDSYNWGGYLIWNWYGRRHVFVDGRPDMYGDAFMDRYIRAYSADPSWPGLFAANRLCYALVEPDSRIAASLRVAPGWSLRYQDHEAVLYMATTHDPTCRV